MNNIEEIRNIFKDEEFDDDVLEYVSNFISEFEELFGEFMSKEVLLGKLKENLMRVEFGSLPKESCLGVYNRKEKKITLSSKIENDENKIKSVLFHEMIHCIRRQNDKVSGFSIGYDLEDFQGEQVRTAVGLEVGFVQFVTQIRDERFYKDEKSFVSYPILSRQIEHLANVVGKDNLINVGLNTPDSLKDIMVENHLIEEGYIGDMEYTDFCEQLDTIWNYEDQIFASKSVEARLLAAIFGKKINTVSEKVQEAKRGLIAIISKKWENKPISDVSELQEIFDEVYACSKNLNATNEHYTYDIIFKKIVDLMEQGMTKSDIIRNLYDNETSNKTENIELLERVVLEQEWEEFLEFPREQKIRMLKEKESSIQSDLNDSMFSDYYIGQTLSQIFEQDLGKNSELLWNYLNKIMEYIDSNGIDINCLSFDIVKMDKFGLKNYINMYETKIKGEELITEYIGTIRDDEEEQIIEMLDMSKGAESANYNVQINKEDNYLKIIHFNSYLEQIKLKYEMTLDRNKKLKEIKAPKVIMDHDNELVEKLKRKLDKIMRTARQEGKSEQDTLRDLVADDVEARKKLQEAIVLEKQVESFNGIEAGKKKLDEK